MKVCMFLMLASVLVSGVANAQLAQKRPRKLIVDEEAVNNPKKTATRFYSNLTGNLLGGSLGLVGGWLWNHRSNSKRKLMKNELKKKIGDGINDLKSDQQRMKSILEDMQKHVDSLSKQLTDKQQAIDSALVTLKSGLQFMIGDLKPQRKVIL